MWPPLCSRRQLRQRLCLSAAVYLRYMCPKPSRAPKVNSSAWSAAHARSTNGAPEVCAPCIRWSALNDIDAGQCGLTRMVLPLDALRCSLAWTHQCKGRHRSLVMTQE
eukprot:jgi/Ulvmu1/2270/UM013_0117.1